MDTISKLNEDNLKYKEILKGFRPPFQYETFKEFYSKCGFTLDDVCHITNRNSKTIKRWERTGAPDEFYLLIYAASGYLLSEAFYGFRVKDNSLYTGTRITYNYGFTAGEIINFSFFNDYSKRLQAENAELRQKIQRQDSDLRPGQGFTGQVCAFKKGE